MTTFSKKSCKNLLVRPFKLVDGVKKAIHQTCPNLSEFCQKLVIKLSETHQKVVRENCKWVVRLSSESCQKVVTTLSLNDISMSIEVQNWLTILSHTGIFSYQYMLAWTLCEHTCSTQYYWNFLKIPQNILILCVLEIPEVSYNVIWY